MKNYLKKCLAYVLSFVLTLGMCTIAYGETTTKARTKVNPDIIKDLTLIGVSFWDKWQLELAEKMTDEQWMEFFKCKADTDLNMTEEERDKAITAFIKNYYGEDYNIFTQLTEEELTEYDEAYYRVRPIYEKQEKRYFKYMNNYPNLDGININYNGEFIDFGSDAPINNSSGDYILLNDNIMKQFGLDYSYDEATRLLTVKSGETEFIICLQEDFTDELYSAGAFPALMKDANDNLYLSIYVLDDLLDYYLYFDFSEEIFYLKDKQKVISGIDENFTIINKLTSEMNSNNGFLAENLKAALTGTLVLYGDTENNHADIQSSFDMNQYNGSFKIKGTLNIDGELLLKLYKIQNTYYFSSTEMDSMIATLRTQLNLFKNAPYELIYNADANLCYLKCEAVNKILELEESTWLKIAPYYTKRLLNLGTKTIGTKLADNSNGNEHYYTKDIEYYKNMIGDKGFTKESSNGVDTYTASYSHNKNDRYKYRKYNQLFRYKHLEFINVSGNISFSEDKDGIKEIHLSGKSTLDIGIPMNISYKSDITREKTDIQFEAVGEFGGKVTANFTSDNSEADNSAVLFAPPAGENVVDY